MTINLNKICKNGLNCIKYFFKKVDIDTFKQIGTFKNGKALIDGKNGFTGRLQIPNGEMFYKTGRLIKSKLNTGVTKKYYYFDGRRSVNIYVNGKFSNACIACKPSRTVVHYNNNGGGYKVSL